MTTTTQQIEANRQNSQKSTGPISPEGKLVVSGNAIKHGICSKSILLPHEDKEAWEALCDALYQEFQPEGHLENLLVENLSILVWRKNRIIQAESEVYCRHTEDLKHKERKSFSIFGDENKIEIGNNLGTAFESDLFLKLSRYETSLDKAFYRTLYELRHTQNLRVQKQMNVLPVKMSESE